MSSYTLIINFKNVKKNKLICDKEYIFRFNYYENSYLHFQLSTWFLRFQLLFTVQVWNPKPSSSLWNPPVIWDFLSFTQIWVYTCYIKLYYAGLCTEFHIIWVSISGFLVHILFGGFIFIWMHWSSLWVSYLFICTEFVRVCMSVY